MKECSACHEIKPLSDFSPNPTTADGLRPNCKKCGVIEATANRDKIRAMWKTGLLTRPAEKLCPTCKETKPNTEFTFTDNNAMGLGAYCKACNRIKFQKLREKNFESMLLTTVKTRAKQQGLPFNLTIHDISIPERCPVLGIELRKNNRSFADSSPSLDKIIPSKGYIKGNVVIISNRANCIKRDATVDELCKLADFYTKLLSSEVAA